VEEELLSPARERIREARRLAVVEAAEQVFAERGFAGATVAEIAARAGYSAGNLYNVFEGKEALFHAVVAARSGLPWRVSGLGQEAVEMQEVLRGRIARLVRSAIQKGEIAREDPELYACLVMGTLRDYLASWIQRGGTSQQLESVAKSLSRILGRAMGIA
jgi:AcrR family transcriptional regulator